VFEEVIDSTLIEKRKETTRSGDHRWLEEKEEVELVGCGMTDPLLRALLRREYFRDKTGFVPHYCPSHKSTLLEKEKRRT